MRLWLVLVAALAACGARPEATTGAAVAPTAATLAATKDSAPTAADLDALTRRLWADAGVTPAPEASDRAFVRRVYLDLLGRIPTPVEVSTFLRHAAPRRREELVDKLLASEEHATYWADIYVDILLPPRVRRHPLYAAGLHRWLIEAFEDARGYDDIIADLVTASGNIADATPAGFVGAQYQAGGVDGLAASTIALLVDEDITCAQCHDDPNEATNTQARYEALTAYFSRVHVKRVKNAPPEQRFFVVDLQRPVHPKRFAKIEPAFEGRGCSDTALSARDCLMSLVRTDGRFARAAVRRAWRHFFGTPVDNPEILELLERRFVASGYAYRGLLRTLALSIAYGRSSEMGAPSRGGIEPEDVFARARVRPLDARRLGNSLLVAMSIVPTTPLFVENPPALQMLVEREFARIFPDYAADPSPETNLQRELILLNGRLTNLKAMLSEGGRLPAILDRHDEVARRIEEMFLATYARGPTPEELQHARDILDQADGIATDYADLYAALLTSTEFITNH